MQGLVKFMDILLMEINVYAWCILHMGTEQVISYPYMRLQMLSHALSIVL